MPPPADIRHFCTYPGNGGAGIAALRLVRALRAAGAEASLHGLNVAPDPALRPIRNRRHPLANLQRRLRARQIRRTPPGYRGLSRAGGAFFTDRSAHGVALAEACQGAAVLHFHWMCDLLDYEHTLRRLPPSVQVVWTLHDMGAFTGGCSYSLGCDGFTRDCRGCPQLPAGPAAAEAAASHARRLKAVREHLAGRLTLVTPSAWLAEEARRSSIFRNVRCEVIPNAFPLDVFTPGARFAGRQRYGLEEGPLVVLFSAAAVDNPVKGMRLLLDALPKMQWRYPSLQVAYVGHRVGDDLPESWKWMGSHSDEHTLAEIYAGADVLVVPSLADNYPNVIGEALACGVPVVASDIGGIPDLVRPTGTGQLFAADDARSFLSVLDPFLEELPITRETWSRRCRAFAEATFNGRDIAVRHLDLYADLSTSS